MRLVVDSNVLFTSFWKDSIFHELKGSIVSELYSPEFALEEINRYSLHILKKAKLSRKEFNSLKVELASKVIFVPFKEYSLFIKKIKDSIKEFSEDEKKEILNDIDFLALAYKLKLPIWSNDKLLKKQKIIDILSIEDIIKLSPKN